MRPIILALFALTATQLGCTAEKFGEPCDGFFANGCKAPMTCMTDDKGKFCSQSCTVNKAFPDMETKCPKGTECVGTSVDGVKGGSIGSMCSRPK